MNLRLELTLFSFSFFIDQGCLEIWTEHSILTVTADKLYNFTLSQSVMLQKIHPKGIPGIPPKMSFNKMRLCEVFCPHLKRSFYRNSQEVRGLANSMSRQGLFTLHNEFTTL